MIRDHEFNGAWWGERVGIVEDPAFFAQTGSRRSARRSRPTRGWSSDARLDTAPDPWQLAASGFAQVDTQLRFRIALEPARPAARSRQRPCPCDSPSDALRPAPRGPADLPHERFRHLPGATREIGHAALRPLGRERCCRALSGVVRRGGRAPASPQGWFLAEPEGGTCIWRWRCCAADAAISGLDLYAAALGAFGARGVRLGEARFSIENRCRAQHLCRGSAPIFRGADRLLDLEGADDHARRSLSTAPRSSATSARYMAEARRARPRSPATGDSRRSVITCWRSSSDVAGGVADDFLHACAGDGGVALRNRAGDEVIVPFHLRDHGEGVPVTRRAPVFVDVRADTFNLDERLLEARSRRGQRRSSRYTMQASAVRWTRFSRSPAARVAVVEDNAHGLFGTYRGKYLGTFGALATRSSTRRRISSAARVARSSLDRASG